MKRRCDNATPFWTELREHAMILALILPPPFLARRFGLWMLIPCFVGAWLAVRNFRNTGRPR